MCWSASFAEHKNIEELKMTKLIKLKTVLERTGLGRSTLYNYINQGMFPQPVSLGERSVAWVESEVEDWIQNQIRRRGFSNFYI